MPDRIATVVRMAQRNLRRHRWRSILTAGGIALAVGMLVWTKAYMDTLFADMVRAATAVEIGQIQINTDEYAERESIFHSFELDPGTLDAIRAVDGVSSAAPRIYAFGLVGNEQRSQVGRLIGVDPDPESRATLMAEGVDDGRWLSPDPAETPGPREAVVGYHLARQLGVGVGDELVVFLQAADGSLGNDLLVVVGTLKTANTAIDRSSVVMHTADLAWSAALEGEAHEIVVSVDDLERVDEIAAAVSAVVPPIDGGPVVRTWKETMGELYAMLETSQASMWISYILIYAIAGMGLLNTQRMSALERRREFGVLIGVGMNHRRIAGMIVVETVLLTFLGALGGIVLGGGLAWYHAVRGLDMGAMTSRTDSFSFMGIAFDERMYFDVHAMALIEPTVIVLFVALLCGLVPAVSALRINAVQAISGRT